MSKLKAKINSMNYKKGFIRIIIAFVVFVLAAGIGTGINFGSRFYEIKNQIEAADESDNKMEKLTKNTEYQKQYESYNNQSENGEYYKEHDGGHSGKYFEGRYKNHEKDREIDLENMIALTTGDKIFLGVAGGVFVILLVIYWIFTMFYAISKAKKVGANPYIFGILTLVTNLIGVAALWFWILIHPVCPECGRIQPMKSKFCSLCGAMIYGECLKCGAKLTGKETYCRECGERCMKEDEKKEACEE